jgi:GTPase
MDITNNNNNIVETIKLIKSPELQPIEFRIGVGGNVDAGKSSFVGVITKNILDNGRGFARSFVLKHKHEKETGRTSSVSHQFIRTPEKVIEFNDLAGHEKYYKCTAKQIANNFLDYIAIIINAGTGIQLMTREHIALAYSLKLPMFVVYTKIDNCPNNIYEINLEYIKSYYQKKMNLEVKIISNLHDLNLITSNFTKGCNFIPIFPVSNVTGIGIDIVKQFIMSLKCYINYDELEKQPANFLINCTYNVQGIGLVISGIQQSGIINKGDVLYLGPNATGFQHDPNTNVITNIPQQLETSKSGLRSASGITNVSGNPVSQNFYKVVIKGIHNNFQENVEFLKAGYAGCFNIKAVGRTIIKRNMIRSGMRILNDIKSVYQFEAKVKIFNSSSTITTKYQPVMHCGGISQTVEIVNMNKEYLRSYDEAIVTFRFLYRPEYLEVGNIFIMREGSMKALGKVLKIII